MLRFLLPLVLVVCGWPACAGEVHTAAAAGDVSRLREILSSNSSLINSADENGATPLHWAADAGRRDVAEFLLSLGADLNARKKDGVTPIHVAAAMGREEMVTLLLRAGADIDATDDLGRTPLALARSRGQTGVVALLLAQGASLAGQPRPREITSSAVSISGRPVAYVAGTVLGVPVNVVYVNLNDPAVHISAAIARTGIGGSESFASFMRRLQPAAAINGTFFSKSNQRPIGDIVVKGRMVHFGGMGTGLCVGPGNAIAFVDTRWGRHTDWRGYETVVCSGPRLITNGSIDLDPRGEGFRDSHVLGRARRTAVGLTYMNRLLLLNTGSACSLRELASIMKQLGCTEAVNFDGGSSVAMHYRGRTVTSPSRQLTNVLLVYESQSADPNARASK